MDLTQFKSTGAEGAVYTVKNPKTGDNLDLKITMLGPDSVQYRAAMLYAARKDMKVGDDQKAPEDMTDQDIIEAVSGDDQLKIMILSMCTSGWVNLEENGKAVKFSKVNAQRIYTEYTWLRNQLWVWLNNQSNFFTVSGESSPSTSDSEPG